MFYNIGGVQRMNTPDYQFKLFARCWRLQLGIYNLMQIGQHLLTVDIFGAQSAIKNVTVMTQSPIMLLEMCIANKRAHEIWLE